MNGTKLTGLWKNKSKNKGTTYLAGNLGPLARVIILPNDFKKGDNEPDYNMWLVPRERNGEAKDENNDGEDVPF